MVKLQFFNLLNSFLTGEHEREGGRKRERARARARKRKRKRKKGRNGGSCGLHTSGSRKQDLEESGLCAPVNVDSKPIRSVFPPHGKQHNRTRRSLPTPQLAPSHSPSIANYVQTKKEQGRDYPTRAVRNRFQILIQVMLLSDLSVQTPSIALEDGTR